MGSATTSGASMDARSLTMATAFSSRAKLGVEADKSTSTVCGDAACTMPFSSKYASSSAVWDVQYVTTMAALATSSVRVQPAASRRCLLYTSHRACVLYDILGVSGRSPSHLDNEYPFAHTKRTDILANI